METTQLQVVFDGALGIRTIEPIRATLLAALEQHQAVRIDCGAAETIDLSFIQLLLAARRSAREAGKALCLAEPAGGALKLALLQGGLLPADDTGQAAPDVFWSGGE